MRVLHLLLSRASALLVASVALASCSQSPTDAAAAFCEAHRFVALRGAPPLEFATWIEHNVKNDVVREQFWRAMDHEDPVGQAGALRELAERHGVPDCSLADAMEQQAQ